MRRTLGEVRALLARLDGEPADAIESETLECKSWSPEPNRHKAQIRELRETTICLANAQGGTIVLGIEDRAGRRQDAIRGVGDLDAQTLRRAIYDGTEPPILIDIEELLEPEGRLLLLHVPRGLPPHTTTEGVGRIRVGKECKPLTGGLLPRLMMERRGRDITAEIVEGAELGDLDSLQIKELQKQVSGSGGRREMATLPATELLENLGLLRDGRVTLAALLLVGESSALRTWASAYEVVLLRFVSAGRYDVRRDLRGPILQDLRVLQETLEAHARLELLQGDGLGELSIPDLTWWTAREGILNAIVHRDYFTHQSVYVELHDDRLEVTSPGGFIGGVTPENILRHAPVRRNPLLADALQAAGFVNRAGMGVDRIYDDLLRLGKGLPRYESDESTVRLILPTRTHKAFARMVAQETLANRALNLDDLILLRSAMEIGEIDRWSAARRMQANEDDAAKRLADLRRRGYLVPVGRGRGTSYRLSKHYTQTLQSLGEVSDGATTDPEAMRRRVLAVLREQGRVTNADVRRLTGHSRSEALRFVGRLRAEGIVEMRGHGRGAYYVPGPRFAE